MVSPSVSEEAMEHPINLRTLKQVLTWKRMLLGFEGTRAVKKILTSRVPRTKVHAEKDCYAIKLGQKIEIRSGEWHIK